jgi:hypothetical protein
MWFGWISSSQKIPGKMEKVHKSINCLKIVSAIWLHIFSTTIYLTSWHAWRTTTSYEFNFTRHMKVLYILPHSEQCVTFSIKQNWNRKVTSSFKQLWIKVGCLSCSESLKKKLNRKMQDKEVMKTQGRLICQGVPSGTFLSLPIHDLINQDWQPTLVVKS